MRIFEAIPGFMAPVYSVIARKSPFMRQVREEIIADICAHNPSGTMLDVGTGPGYVPLELARRLPLLSLTGIDLSTAMVEIAQGNARAAGLSQRVTFEAAHAAHLPFADGSFDTVISTLSSHHWKDIGGYLSELGRVVKKGGRVLVYDFCRDVPRQVRRDIRERYGWFFSPLFLWMARTHSALGVETARRIAEGTRFSGRTVTAMGIVLKLELVK